MGRRARRQGYDGIVLAAPASVPYERFSVETAHWWIARALRMSLQAAGLAGTCVAGRVLGGFLYGVRPVDPVSREALSAVGVASMAGPESGIFGAVCRTRSPAP